MLRILAACAIFCLSANAAQAQEVVLRLHQFLPAASTIPAKGIAPWIERVEKDSGGRIKIEHYPSMQLGGKPPALFDQAKDGVVDIVWTVLGYTPGRFKVAEAFELPFIATSGEASSRAFYEFVSEHGLKEFKGVKPIALHVHGPGVLHFRKTPARTLDDLNGLKLRGPSRQITKLFAELGATPIGMPVPAAPQALSRGVIDGLGVPWQVTIPLKIAELTNGHTEFSGENSLYTIGFGLVMNQARYDALPDDLKAVIDRNSGAELSAQFGAAMDADDAPGREIAQKAGNQIVVLDEDQTAIWRAAAKPVEEQWIAEMTQDGHDGAGLVRAARALIAKHTAALSAQK